MRKIKKRKIFLITGSECSGKSKLGHLLASHKEALFSYSTLGYRSYFSENNFLINENKINALKADLDKIFFFQNGGKTKDGSRWLKEDKLFFYNFKKISSYLKSKIKKGLSISEFYYYWNEALIYGRKNGSETSFTIFEIENLFNNKVLNHLKKSKKNFKIVNIYRDPFEQIKSIKINTLLRGGISKNGFHGALSGKKNYLKLCISEIIDQYNFIKKKKIIMHMKLNDVRSINAKNSKNLSKYLFDKVDRNFQKFLINNSKLINYRSKYFDLKRISQSYATEKIQRRLKLKFRLSKNNIEDHMYSYEKFFYLKISKLLTVNNYKIRSYEFLYFELMSLLFGFKDIRKNLPIIKLLKIRFNSFIIVNSVKKLLMTYNFIKY